MATHNDRILTLALEALRSERRKIDEEIASIESSLGQGSKAKSKSLIGRRSRRITTAGRKAISDAMKKRWAAYRALKTKSR